MRRPLTGVLLAVLAGALPASAADENLAAKELESLLAVCAEWAAAGDDAARLAVEARAAKLPPIGESAVAPLAECLFRLADETGPKLKKSGKDFFYDRKAKKGLYMVSASGKRRGGLLLALHGGGENAGDAGSAHGTWSTATGEGLTVIAPEAMKKVSSAWNEEAEERFVLDLIDAAKRTFDVDPDRVYVAGHSMGGDGSWMIGGRNADLFAAAAPLAGSVMPYMRPGTKNKRATPVSDYMGLMEGVLPNLMWVPYHISHSADDENEAIHPDDIATSRLRRLAERFPGRYAFVYDRIDGNGHALPPKGVKPILEWMTARTRKTYPEEVVWETWWPWKRQMYWLWHPAPRDAWRFHAKVAGPNHVEVEATTKPVQGRTEPEDLELTLLLSPRMFDLDRPLRVTSGGKILFDGPVHRSLWALLVSIGRRNDRAQWFEGHVTVTMPRKPWRDLWDTE